MPRACALALVALVAATPVAATAAEPSALGARSAKQARLKAFSSCAGLVGYARRQAQRLDGSAGLAPPPVTPVDRRGGPLPPAPEPGVPQPLAAPDERSSQTNVQEAGVDEPDLVKTSRGRIFALAGGMLHVVDATGEQPRLLGSIALQGFGHELLLHGDRALVVGHQQAEVGGTRLAPFPYGEPQTLLADVDVRDPAAMRILRTETVDGSYLSARQSGETARVVVSSRPRALTEDALLSRPAGWVPSSVLERRLRGRRIRRPLAACGQVRRPASFSGFGTLSILTIDLAKGLPAVDVDALMAGGEIVYGSRQSLYVATQRWVPEPPSLDGSPPRTASAIHRFEASEHGTTRYRASGSVPGFLLNQFSLSEHGGVLRVASTDSPPWWGGAERTESESFVSVLDERAGSLVEIGRVGGLGRGERIYSVRFIRDAAFVVTFRQVDPLYTVDLADPSRPRAVGELKIRGYSAYLHPAGDDLLIGVGQDATERGATLGTQISLFDVSDLRNPRRLHQRTLAGPASSEAEYDHHAFLWWPPAGLAVLPLQLHSRPDPFAGAVGVRVGRGGIEEAGRTSHGADGELWPVRRAFVVDGRLFTLSDLGLEQNDLGTLAGRAWVRLPRSGP